MDGAIWVASAVPDRHVVRGLSSHLDKTGPARRLWVADSTDSFQD